MSRTPTGNCGRCHTCKPSAIRLSRPRRRQPEKREQAAIVRLLRLLGAAVWVLGTRRRRTDYPGTMQTPGLPDLIASLPRGRQGCAPWPVSDTPRVRLEVEVKAPGGRLSAAQRYYQRHALACGIAHVVGGLDDVVAWLVDRGFLRADRFPHYRVRPPSVAAGSGRARSCSSTHSQTVRDATA